MAEQNIIYVYWHTQTIHLLHSVRPGRTVCGRPIPDKATFDSGAPERHAWCDPCKRSKHNALTKKLEKNYVVVIEEGEDWMIGSIKNKPGYLAQGKTIEEVFANLGEVIALMEEEA